MRIGLSYDILHQCHSEWISLRMMLEYTFWLLSNSKDQMVRTLSSTGLCHTWSCAPWRPSWLAVCYNCSRDQELFQVLSGFNLCCVLGLLKRIFFKVSMLACGKSLSQWLLRAPMRERATCKMEGVMGLNQTHLAPRGLWVYSMFSVRSLDLDFLVKLLCSLVQFENIRRTQVSCRITDAH
jgi:hypothetical protein